MDGMTIGEFARVSGLSPKALRLYDDLGLLPPARVDASSGYRFYTTDQLEHARLVSWLRRLGMPLARIRDVCAMDRPRAARAVREFWARTESDHAVRRGLALFLTDHLQGEADGPRSRLALRGAALGDRGRVRAEHQDAVLANGRTLAAADGFGPRGAGAAAAALAVLDRLDLRGLPTEAVSAALFEAADDARTAVHRAAGDADGAAESGTTLTALCWTGSRLATLHIGDGRAYLLRDGRLSRLTEDHTLVRSMVEDGRLTPEEAAVHPQRSLLIRALADGDAPPASHPDTRLRHVRAGDRYLVCTDGLSAVAPEADVRHVLATTAAPADAVRELVRLAHAFGAPDNVGCAVADVVEGEATGVDENAGPVAQGAAPSARCRRNDAPTI